MGCRVVPIFCAVGNRDHRAAALNHIFHHSALELFFTGPQQRESQSPFSTDHDRPVTVIQQMEIAACQHGDLRKGEGALLRDAANGAVRQHHHIVPIKVCDLGQHRPVLQLKRGALPHGCQDTLSEAVIPCVFRRQKQCGGIQVRDSSGLADTVIMAPVQRQVQVAQGHQIIPILRCDGHRWTSVSLFDVLQGPYHFRGLSGP